MYSDGFKYWLAYKKGNTKYFRCCRYKSSCPGRCVLENGKLRNTTAHSHPPEPDRALVDKFRKVLTQRAAQEKGELYSIYWEESLKHSDAAMIYSFTQAESCMRKARRKKLPQVPNTISELGDLLCASNLFRISSGTEREPFYQTTITLEDCTCVVFAHRKTIEKLGRVEELHVDASLCFEPQPPNFRYSLLTAHAIQQYQSFPVLYVIMTTKTHSGFAAVFAYMREQLSVAPSNIFAEFDATLLDALALTFPEATVRGHFFHFTEAVLKQTKALALTRELAKGHGSAGLRMLLVLPLLPANYMRAGLQDLRKWLKEKNVLSRGTAALCDYVEQRWLMQVGAEKMSVFGLPHCVTNHIQNFNRDLRGVLVVAQPMIWNTLEALTHVATRAYVRLNKKAKGLLSSRPPKKGQFLQDTIISNATQLWILTPVHLRNPLQFLQISSHCINDALFAAGADDVKAGATPAASSLGRGGDDAPPPLTYTIQTMNSSGSLFQMANTPPVAPVIPQQPTAAAVTSPGVSFSRTDPPPLAFYPKAFSRKNISLSEPPPLIYYPKPTPAGKND